MQNFNPYCFFQENDFTQDAEIKAILSKGIYPETILSACTRIKQKENSPIFKLPSDIDLKLLFGRQELFDIKAATDFICRNDYKPLLDCIDGISGSPVMLKVSGAFSTLLSVTGSEFLFRQLIKSEDEIISALECINSHTAALIKKSAMRGVNIISYADPSAMPKVIGEKLYLKYSVEAAYHLLCLTAPYLSKSVMHICPQTSIALEKYKLCFFEEYPCRHNNLITDLLVLSKNKDIHFTGHVCMNADKGINNKLYILKE